ncbi:hypothetical protein BDY21DRAFT_417508 [Lineolata rhizophorae]|uniref:DUF7053 domain-containing protein n=1 Tax=Lineolata rhizophorae TaxID=578093 RepID=A0A6A6NNE5_9PEZI|nr:hypothetical protein BDY21DRAFT_417508 [Lineolata rhizophorae]
MSKRTVFTTITPLPAELPRSTVLSVLHDHAEMIDLNPLVIDRFPVAPPETCPADEAHCTWYQITDKLSYLPGGLATGKVSYHAAFHDLPKGLQTHVYAPMGLEIREKWTLGGSLRGEAREPVELGLGAPADGLYLREDVDMRCNVLMTAFVRKTLRRAHGMLVDKMLAKARADAGSATASDTTASNTTASNTTSNTAHQQYQHQQYQHQHQQYPWDDKPLPGPPPAELGGQARFEMADPGPRARVPQGPVEME